MIGRRRSTIAGTVNVRSPPWYGCSIEYGPTNEWPPNKSALSSLVRNDRVANVATEMTICQIRRGPGGSFEKRGRTVCQSTSVPVVNTMAATRKKKKAPAEREKYR